MNVNVKTNKPSEGQSPPKEEKPAKSKQADKDALEFLPAALEVADTPPPALGRVLALTIAAFFTTVVVWAALSPIDIVAVADGKIVPTGQIKTVQTAQPGIVTDILIKEGDNVEAGQLVVRIDDTEAKTTRLRIEHELNKASLEEAVALALLTDRPSDKFVPPVNARTELVELSRGMIESRWENFTAALRENDADKNTALSTGTALEDQVRARHETVKEFEDLLERETSLQEKGLSTNSQTANLRLQLITNKTDLQSLEQQLVQSELLLKQLAATREKINAQFKGEVKQQLANARQQALIASEELERQRERESQFLIESPVDGTVHELMVHTVGAVVSPAEPLATIVPAGVKMEVESRLLNKDVGTVQVGMPAEVKLEAFPFTKYGVIDGSVTHISPDALVDPQLGPVYLMKVSLEKETIAADGRDVSLAPGMRTTIEVRTGNRTVLDFFLTPLLRYRDESIRER